MSSRKRNRNENKWLPDPAREASWEAHKAACYAQWREERLTKALGFISAAYDRKDRGDRLGRVTKKYGKRFAKDVMEIWRDEQRRETDRAVFGEWETPAVAEGQAG